MLKKTTSKFVAPADVKAILERAIPWAFEAQQSQHHKQQAGGLAPGNNYKGQRGRIGIVGGSRDYTGAPYFAAISSMKLGCDLSYVICASGASQIIKCHSPELIVMPLLDSPAELDTELDCLLERLHALVIGPGLGRDEQLLGAAKKILLQAKKRRLAIVIDADGLLLVNEDLDLVRNYDRAILTPNRIELERLLNAVYKPKVHRIKSMSNEEIKRSILSCSRDLQVSILSKGPIDIIAEPSTGFYLETPAQLGSDRRCGGQGDLLSGMTACFYYWLLTANQQASLGSGSVTAETINSGQLQRPVSIKHASVYSGYLGSLVTRYCNQLAFAKVQHSALASNMIEEIHQARRWLVTDFLK